NRERQRYIGYKAGHFRLCGRAQLMRGRQHYGATFVQAFTSPLRDIGRHEYLTKRRRAAYNRRTEWFDWHGDISMRETHHPEQNHILAALPRAERQRLDKHLQLVPMPLGTVLYESGDTLR